MNFRQVGKKIKTIGNVKKITKAMQMVSAVKMKKAQKVALQGKPYREILEEMLHRVTFGSENPLMDLKAREETNQKDLYILVTTNKGLCGSFNFNLLKKVILEVEFKKSTFITIGKKGSVVIPKMGGEVIADFSEHLPFIDTVSAIFDLSLEEFRKKYKRIFVVYNRFISTFKMEPTIEQLLPLSVKELKEIKDKKQSSTEYIIEPDTREIIDSLIKDYIRQKISMAILDSEAAEHSARMMAMKNATDNAEDIIFNLTLVKNKLRQSSITNELLDMTIAKESAEAN